MSIIDKKLLLKLQEKCNKMFLERISQTSKKWKILLEIKRKIRILEKFMPLKNLRHYLKKKISLRQCMLFNTVS
jgi:hypothetical protein